MIGLFALVTAALFTGAAVYINIAEHPARMTLDAQAALRQWAPAYRRGYVMQASLALLAGLLAIAAWWSARDRIWLFAAGLMLANWPYTLLAIRPVNDRLKAALHEGEGADPHRLLRLWNRLHAGRSMLGAVATGLMVWALIDA